MAETTQKQRIIISIGIVTLATILSSFVLSGLYAISRILIERTFGLENSKQGAIISFLAISIILAIIIALSWKYLMIENKTDKPKLFNALFFFNVNLIFFSAVISISGSTFLIKGVLFLLNRKMEIEYFGGTDWVLSMSLVLMFYFFLLFLLRPKLVHNDLESVQE